MPQSPMMTIVRPSFSAFLNSGERFCFQQRILSSSRSKARTSLIVRPTAQITSGGRTRPDRCWLGLVANERRSGETGGDDAS